LHDICASGVPFRIYLILQGSKQTSCEYMRDRYSHL
jgi:hypothetical protein